MVYKPLPQPAQTNAQVQEYLQAAQQGKGSLFVVSVPGGWTIRSLGSKQAGVIFPTIQEALHQARTLGKPVFSPLDKPL